jgi:hypothetical protein
MTVVNIASGTSSFGEIIIFTTSRLSIATFVAVIEILMTTCLIVNISKLRAVK